MGLDVGVSEQSLRVSSRLFLTHRDKLAYFAKVLVDIFFQGTFPGLSHIPLTNDTETWGRQCRCQSEVVQKTTAGNQYGKLSLRFCRWKTSPRGKRTRQCA